MTDDGTHVGRKTFRCSLRFIVNIPTVKTVSQNFLIYGLKVLMKKLKPCAGRILFGKRMFLRKPGKRKVIQCFNQPAFGSGPGDIELPDKNFSLKTILNPRMSAIKTRQTCNNFFRLLDRHMVQRHRRRSSHADKAGDQFP